jgi:hypothetical protein
MPRSSLRSALPALASGLFGGVFLITIVGPAVVDPQSVRWVLQGDWQWHFLGWHFFRNEPWHLPPGALTSYMEPIGSAIGYTDSIPLAAFLLKPFASVLPNPFQYLGLWLLVCFVLQGIWGSLLVGLWTNDPLLRALGGCLFVLVPTLLARFMHPALCSHWILLWALWVPLREPVAGGPRAVVHFALPALISGLLHPYLAVMVLVILTSAAVKRVVMLGKRHAAEAGLMLAATAGGVIAGWWASGLLMFPSGERLETGGLGLFSTNLLAPVNPGDRSRWMPGLPWMTLEQQHEGFHYLGLGLLLLCAVALAWVIAARRRIRPASLPLVVALAGLALFSLSPRVTFGDRVIVDLIPQVGESSTFRASARFFWPITYATVAAAIGVVCATRRRAVAAALLAGALVVQAIELQPWYVSLRHGFRNPVFLGAHLPTISDEWAMLLPNVDRIRMYWPDMCGGPAPAPMTLVAYLAGLYGLALNDGFAARMDRERVGQECQRLRGEFLAGARDDRTVYLLAADLVPEFRRQSPSRCRLIDGIPVCVSPAAAERISIAW